MNEIMSIMGLHVAREILYDVFIVVSTTYVFTVSLRNRMGLQLHNERNPHVLLLIPYSGKNSRDNNFTDFAVCLTSAKILSANKAFSLFCRVTLANIRENFIREFSFLEPSTKISRYTVDLITLKWY